MASGCASAYADTVSDEFVQSVCPDAYDDFIKELDKLPEIDINDFFTQEDYKEYTDDKDHELFVISNLYKELVDRFENATGLDLTLNYHDSEGSGDIYDEVDGFFWSVGGVYQYTEAGEKFQENIERKFFVVYG